MKKQIFVLVLAVVLLVGSIPVLAKGSGNPGDGDPPGWSQVNPGTGGSEGPGDGPGNPAN